MSIDPSEQLDDRDAGSTAPQAASSTTADRSGWRAPPFVRRVLLGVVGLIVVGWLIGEGPLAGEVWRQLCDARRGWLVVLAVATTAAMVNLALFHAAAQRVAGVRVRRFELVEPALVANSLNMLTKSGGLAGLAPIVTHARRAGRPVAGAVAAYVLVAVVGQWTFAVVLAVAMVVIWSTGHLTFSELAASAVFAILVIVQLVVVAAAVRRSARLDRWVAFPGAWWARRRRRPVPGPSAHVAELHDCLDLVRRHPRRCLPVVLHGFAVEAGAVVQLTAAVAATGQGVHVVPALLAYSIGVLFAVVGFMPGGIGLVEVSSAAVLVASGIGVVPAAAAVMLFRAGELWLPVALGALAALRLRARRAVAT